MAHASNRHAKNLHPRLHRWAILYVLAVWYGFSGSEYTDYLLFVVTAFLVFCVAFVEAVGRLHRRHPEIRPAIPDSFKRWARSYVDVADEPVKGYTAAVEILLPLGAVAFGMLGFALLAHIVG